MPAHRGLFHDELLPMHGYRANDLLVQQGLFPSVSRRIVHFGTRIYNRSHCNVLVFVYHLPCFFPPTASGGSLPLSLWPGTERKGPFFRLEGNVVQDLKCIAGQACAELHQLFIEVTGDDLRDKLKQDQ